MVGKNLRSLIPRGLRPPVFDIRMLREEPISDVLNLASKSFLTVISGPRGSGASTIANLAIKRGFFPKNTECIWINLTDKSTLSKIFARLIQVVDKTNPQEDYPENIVSWLEENKFSLVLDGLNHRNMAEIKPLITYGTRQIGPSQILVTSGIKVTTRSEFNIPPLSLSEAIEYFEAEQIEFNSYAVSLAFGLLEIWPRTILGAIREYGVFDADKAKKIEAKITTDFLLEINEGKRKVIWALIFLGPDFDEKWASILTTKCEIPIEARDLIAEFEKRYLIKPRKDNKWEVRLFYDGNLVGLVSPSFEKDICDLGMEYFSKKINFKPNELFVVNSYPDAVDAMRVVRLLDKMNVIDYRKEALFNVAVRIFQSNGNLKDLQAATDYKISTGKYRKVQWLRYKQANSKIFSGKLIEALDELDYLFHELLGDGDSRDNQLYQSIIRQICQLLLYADKQEDAVKILSTLIKTSDHSQTDHTVSSQLVALLATGLQQLGFAQECIDINQEILGKRMGGLSGKFSQHLSGIRTALALIDLGETTKAIQLLKAAKEYFFKAPKPDMKAHCWSSSILAATYLKTKSFQLAEDEIRYLIGQVNNEERQLSTVDLLRTYKAFRESKDVPKVQKIVQDEIARIHDLERQILSMQKALNSKKLLNHIFLDLDIELNSVFKFNLNDYEIYSLNKPYKMDERFSKNLTKKISQEDDEEVLDEIFRERTPEQIFNIHIMNKVIANACKNQPLLARKYILPHLTLISKNLDAVIFIYARCLEAINEDVECIKLLSNVKNKSSFDYNNIMANALGKSDFGDGLRYHKRALKSLPYFRFQQRAQTLNNIATLIHSHKQVKKYPLAAKYCKMAIPIIRKRNWRWAERTLLIVQLEMCKFENVEKTIYSHHKEFRVGVATLKEILPRVHNFHNRRQAFNYLTSSVDTNGFLKPKVKVKKKTIKDKKMSNTTLAKDFIVFALPEEMHAAKVFLRKSGAIITSNMEIGASYPVEYAEIDIDSRKYKFGLMCSGLTGSETMKALLVALDNNVSPRNVILVGMMAGKKGKAKILDVIAPIEIYDGRNLGTKNGKISVKDMKSNNVDYRLLHRLQSSLGDTREELKLRIITDRKTATVGSTIDSIDHELAIAIFGRDEKIIGLEMEGYALVQQHLDQLRNNNPHVQYVVIKGVADYAGEIPDSEEVDQLRKVGALQEVLDPPNPRENEELKKRLQSLATENALRVAIDLLKRYSLTKRNSS